MLGWTSAGRFRGGVPYNRVNGGGGLLASSDRKRSTLQLTLSYLSEGSPALSVFRPN
jgi:hypothetical protein